MKREFLHLRDYIQDLQSRGCYFFDRNDAISHIGSSSTNFKRMAQRLSEKHQIKRLLGNCIVIVPVEYQSVGVIPPTWFIHDFMTHIGVNYHVGLLTAAAIYGASHQQPMVFQVVCDKVLRPIKVGNQHIVFYYRKNIDKKYSDFVKTPTGKMLVSKIELTLCDCLRYIDAVGGINQVATLFKELFEENAIDINKIIGLLDNGFIELANVQRLGYLMEYIELNEFSDKLYQQIKNRGLRYYSLVSSNHSTVGQKKNSKWKLIINKTVELDDL